MTRHLFDTGFLSVTHPEPFVPSVAALGTKGAPTALVSPGPPANVLDGNGATDADFAVADGANYEFLRIDLGSAQEVVSVTLTGVTKTGAPLTGLKCIVSNTASLTNPPSTTALAATQAFAGSMSWDGSAAPATGRYLYIVPVSTGAGSYSISEIAVVATVTFNFAVLQSISVTAGYQAAQLRTTAHQTNFPIDVAHHSGAIMLDAKHAEIEQGALARALACDEVTGVSWNTLTPISGSTPLPPLTGLFEGKDSGGKRMRLRCPVLYSPGAKLDFSLGQFATEGVQLAAYLDSTSDLVASWEFED